MQVALDPYTQFFYLSWSGLSKDDFTDEQQRLLGFEEQGDKPEQMPKLPETTEETVTAKALLTDRLKALQEADLEKCNDTLKLLEGNAYQAPANLAEAKERLESFIRSARTGKEILTVIGAFRKGKVLAESPRDA